jgi:hypothetical protein
MTTLEWVLVGYAVAATIVGVFVLALCRVAAMSDRAIEESRRNDERAA